MRLPFLIPIAKALRDRAVKRPPDLCIGGTEREGGSYMDRWYLLPRNKYFCLYLHRFNHSDDDRALHDHPAHNLSFVFDGGYIEHTEVRRHRVAYAQDGKLFGTPVMVPVKQFRKAGDVVWRKATAMHRISLHNSEWKYADKETFVPLKCWTLFVFTYKFRGWGFACPKGWVPQQQFIHHNGCGED